jgi:serine/threonine protein kinase
MTGNDDQADRRLLADFLSGRLSDADAERVAARLADDPRFAALARDLGHTDPLVEAARATAGAAPPADAPPLRDLMGRLEQLRPSSATTRVSGPAPTLAEFPFLRPAQAPDELGRLGGFRILQVLGKGGMGLVFRAEDVQLRRQVALKVIKPECTSNPDYRARFLREARAAAALHHDHVMTVHQVGEDNGVLFLAMPLLSGETLEARLSRQPPLPVAEQLRIGHEMAEGLAAAHAAGLIHRDIKPSNIWLEADSGRVKLLDFGLALPVAGAEPLTETGLLLGTPAYMSPEQADGGRIDGRSDLFSLGCVLYRMATSKQPFARDTVTATLRAVADHTPAPPRDIAPDVPPPLSDLIVRLLAKSPDGRPASAGVTADALRAIEQGDVTTIDDRPPPPPKARRRTVLAALGTAALIGTAALVLLGLWAFRAHDPIPSPATEIVATTPTVPGPTRAPHEGYVDVIVWRTAGGVARRLRLTDDGALPLHPGDQFRIEAKVTPKAYLYLFRISTEGEADPVYPWQPGTWGTRPPEETPRDELSLPPRSDKGYTIKGDRDGMETWLLLARPSPLDADDATVRGWFEGVKPQRPVQDARSAVWFENGRVVHDDPRLKRDPLLFEESNIDDSVLRMQDLLRERLQPHAAFTTAVSYARLGK